jgi:acyl phosphate:glycerol-3-phosphate acyltransferase
VLAYLLGSVSFAIVVSKLMRLPDPRAYGSKNPGATNVLRSGSKVAAILTLAGDAGKGWLAVWLAPQLWQAMLPADCPLILSPACAPDYGQAAGIAAVAVFLGHLYPIFYRFKGGKGVATAAGALFGFNPWLGAGTIATFVIIAVFFRYVSLASMIAAVFAVFFSWLILQLEAAIVWAVAVMAVLLVVRHGENIKRLIGGTEAKLGEKKATPPPDPSAASR